MMFDPNASKRTKKDVTTRAVIAWARAHLPVPILAAAENDAALVNVSTREVQCGDPDCSPIDTVIALIFQNGRNAMTGLPMEMSAVKESDVVRSMRDMGDELIACFENREYQRPGGAPPSLSSAGEAALERVAAALRRELLQLQPADVAGVCAAAIDMLEQIEEDALRPVQRLPPGAPRALDPSSKILSASQKNDVAAVMAYIAEGISPSYANSLGQTPLHIACMWGNADVAKALIDAGADVHAMNQLSNATPLHIVASSTKEIGGRLACGRLLLAAGADSSKRDADGQLPWQKANSAGSEALRELLTPAQR